MKTVNLKVATTISRQAVTKHLQTLQFAGIVSSSRAGRDRLWQIEKRKLNEVSEYLNQISANWDATLERLRSFVEVEFQD